MFDVCSMYVRYMFDVCSIYVRCMFDICSMYVRCMFNVCSIYVCMQKPYYKSNTVPISNTAPLLHSDIIGAVELSTHIAVPFIRSLWLESISNAIPWQAKCGIRKRISSYASNTNYYHVTIK